MLLVVEVVGVVNEEAVYEPTELRRVAVAEWREIRVPWQVGWVRQRPRVDPLQLARDQQVVHKEDGDRVRGQHGSPAVPDPRRLAPRLRRHGRVARRGWAAVQIVAQQVAVLHAVGNEGDIPLVHEHLRHVPLIEYVAGVVLAHPFRHDLSVRKDANRLNHVLLGGALNGQPAAVGRALHPHAFYRIVAELLREVLHVCLHDGAVADVQQRRARLSIFLLTQRRVARAAHLVVVRKAQLHDRCARLREAGEVGTEIVGHVALHHGPQLVRPLRLDGVRRVGIVKHAREVQVAAPLHLAVGHHRATAVDFGVRCPFIGQTLQLQLRVDRREKHMRGPDAFIILRQNLLSPYTVVLLGGIQCR
ncbi:RNA editing 3' terminal uridylyl transferase 2 [Strigomonas culicis]|uniref:RNA editing 3' terminal uridylyl transferase 2 n=1 Tax=Strigomonas culicis TaxID=28005 RepID=S9WCV4_9TRYP|nr:RNA editing 3' terminal uridylyl transferase 2 [Strigomonas culicis]|eukprot:EPY33905.1 RNA editing 3' terminal uridylyl transferase 2 [Strigomonas culicis]